jgi:hypothetical protein
MVMGPKMSLVSRLQAFFEQIGVYLSWLKDIDKIISLLASIFAPLSSIVDRLLGLIGCTTDEDGDISCGFLDRLNWFLKMLQNFPGFAVDFLVDVVFKPLLIYIQINFTIDWKVDWIEVIAEIKEWVSTK